MTYINNPNFSDRIVKAARAEGRFDHTDVQTLNVLVELETRHLLEAAFKFMEKDRRDVIALADVVAAARELGHGELIAESNCE
jgi:histone H3/H4